MPRRRPRTTAATSADLPRPAPSGRRFAGRSAALGLLGFGLASVAAHNVQRVVKLRQHARSLRVDLDHDGEVHHGAPSGAPSSAGASGDGTVGQGLHEPTELWVLGDSASDGYGLVDPADAFPRQVATTLAAETSRRVRLRALGRDGARIADVTRVQAPLLRPTADAVVVMVGANDVFGRRTRKQVLADTAAMLAAVRDASDGALLVVAGCPHFGRAPGFPQPLRTILGWRSRVTTRAMWDACADVGVPFVDLVAGTRPDLFGEDGVHPSADGSRLAARGVVDALVATASTT